MLKLKPALIGFLTVILVVSFALVGCTQESEPTETGAPTETEPAEEKVMYIGGTMSLTGAYAEDSAAILAAYENYVKYVNDTKNLAPWRDVKFPEDITLEVLYRDDELKPAKALSIYEELKEKGMLVFRASGSPQAQALLDPLAEDGMGAPSMASGPYLLTPPKTIITYYPIYTDDAAAVAEWFLEDWDKDRKPRFAYLTADNASGKSVVTPELTEYLENELGFEVVGEQYVPLAPTSPPTTQLMWLKENNVDLTFGFMVNPGSQPTIKEAKRLGMGPDQDYEITFGFASPSHLAVFAPAMGELGDGTVVAGSFPPFTHTDVPGIKFANDLMEEYGSEATHIMYVGGLLEGMIQVEALRLALQEIPYEELTDPKQVLENGFWQIENLETGNLSATPLTFGEGDVEGSDQVRLDQVQNGEVVHLGDYPVRHLYAKE
ncbi:MAG: ABC transporter substrate-binding protein [Dehalococcoidia bacterium]